MTGGGGDKDRVGQKLAVKCHLTGLMNKSRCDQMMPLGPFCMVGHPH